ncbi:hypothetical protein GF312_17045 [Candidatus Poribacteria bacterium]|nr:hypothetical protein [Candidatus Poribacteria bacterium]
MNNAVYDALIEFLYSGKIPRESIEEYVFTIPNDTYQQIKLLKQLQRRHARLQVANSAYRESPGMQMISHIRRIMLRKPDPVDEIRKLSERINQQQAELRKVISMSEMSDNAFFEYRPCGDEYIRIRPDAQKDIMDYFFQKEPETNPKEAVNRFNSIIKLFQDFPPDIRVLGFAALLCSAVKDFDNTEFLKWDKRLLNLIYGPNIEATHPLSLDRFLVHAVIYGALDGEIEDRYIAFRIGWDMFRDQWSRHFSHPVRALSSAAYLLRSVEHFPKSEGDFREFYQSKMERYGMLMRSIHNRATAPDEQLGRGMKIGGSDSSSESTEISGGGAPGMFGGGGMGKNARIGIPDPVFVSAARLVGLPATIGNIFQRFDDLSMAMKKLNDPSQAAAILADTPIFPVDRRDSRDSFRAEEPSDFAMKLQERTRLASQMGAHLTLKTVHGAVIALHPGPVENSIQIFEELWTQLPEIPETSRRLATFLLMDASMPFVRDQRFAYDLWFSEGVG